MVELYNRTVWLRCAASVPLTHEPSPLIFDKREPLTGAGRQAMRFSRSFSTRLATIQAYVSKRIRMIHTSFTIKQDSNIVVLPRQLW